MRVKRKSQQGKARFMTRAKDERTEARRTGYVMRREHAVSALHF